MMIARWLLVIVAAVGSSMVCTGCWTILAAGAAAGGVAYVMGDLEATVEASPRDVADAAESALKEMDISVLTSQASDLDAKVEARSAQDRDVTVKATRLTDTTSKLSIRVGAFGDEAMSRTIYERIKARL